MKADSERSASKWIRTVRATKNVVTKRVILTWPLQDDVTNSVEPTIDKLQPNVSKFLGVVLLKEGPEFCGSHILFQAKRGPGVALVEVN